MQKGFTLLESLIALLVISVLLTSALPTWQHYRQQSILQKEQQKLYIFLRQIQARVENSSDIWLLISAYFYFPAFEDTLLISKRYYPFEITRLSGIRNTASTACFVLQANHQRTLFSFFNVGSLKLKDNQSLSACVNDEE